MAESPEPSLAEHGRRGSRSGLRSCSSGGWRERLSAALALVVALGLAFDRADAGTTDYQVKAAYLYNFAKFVVWPEEVFADSSAVLTIGVFGEDPFGGGLEGVVAGKTIDQRRVHVLHLRKRSEIVACHILFLPFAAREEMPQLLEIARGSPVLTVGESPDFLLLGGMINFTVEDKKVRFEVNLDAAAEERLRISSKLLSVATSVRGDGGARTER